MLCVATNGRNYCKPHRRGHKKHSNCVGYKLKVCKAWQCWISFYLFNRLSALKKKNLAEYYELGY